MYYTHAYTYIMYTLANTQIVKNTLALSCAGENTRPAYILIVQGLEQVRFGESDRILLLENE